jgi:hypothetical protein
LALTALFAPFACVCRHCDVQHRAALAARDAVVACDFGGELITNALKWMT